MVKSGDEKKTFSGAHPGVASKDKQRARLLYSVH